MDDRTLKYIRLAEMKGFGPVSQNRLLSLAGGIDECFSMDVYELMQRDRERSRHHRIGEKRLQLFEELRQRRDEDNAPEIRIASRCSSEGIKVIMAFDPQYPERFRRLEEMPVVLYVKGELKINSFDRSVGIIGARRCTRDGRDAAIELTKKEVSKGSCVISGMAKGIDSYAHTAALKAGGYTIAVLGSGPDICYPKEHITLYELIGRQGCLLSEYPPGTEARQYQFVCRNRLIAALSDTLHVIDAGRKSGTETTVEKCKKYGNEVITCVDR